MQNRIFLIISLVSLALFFIQCNSNEKALGKKLDEMATSLNESVPVMLDQFTRFDGASVTPDNVFRYTYTVVNTSNPDSLVQNVVKVLKESIGKEFATNPDLLIFKQNKVTIEYIYNDENGRTIRALQITPEDYQ